MPTLISGSTGVNKITDGTIVDADINASAAITGSKLVMPTGSVLQVVTNTYATETTTTSNTFVSTGFSASITPSATSSKILCLVHLAGLLTHNTTANLIATLYRDSTNLATGAGTTASSYDAFVSFWSNVSEQHAGSGDFSVLDSPSTTSAITYTPKFGSVDGETAYVHVWYQTSTIILLEIAG